MVEQIPTIEAGERLAYISDTSVASGAVKKGDAQKHLRQLKRQAGHEQSRPATVNDLGALGIPVVRR